MTHSTQHHTVRQANLTAYMSAVLTAGLVALVGSAVWSVVTQHGLQISQLVK